MDFPVFIGWSLVCLIVVFGTAFLFTELFRDAEQVWMFVIGGTIGMLLLALVSVLASDLGVPMPFEDIPPEHFPENIWCDDGSPARLDGSCP